MDVLFQGITGLDWRCLTMFAVGAILIWLAVKKDFEPMLLLPIGFGAILANIPGSSAVGPDGVLTFLRDYGIGNELFPCLIFLAVGAMMDFKPLLQRPFIASFGLAAQAGILFTFFVAWKLLGYSLQDATSIGIIGAADGPTSIFVASRLSPTLLAPITVAAYSYMALVPIIQPPVIRLLTSKRERQMRMPYSERPLPKTVIITFPVVTALVVSLLAPPAAALIGMLMFGNLIRECGVLERLSKSAQSELANLVTLLLGITIGSTMDGASFLNQDTLFILGLGLVAFVMDTAGGVLYAKFCNLFLRHKVNPMIGAAGISAFPMSARVVQRLAQQEDPSNILLAQSISANVAGQIGSVFVGGMLFAVVLWRTGLAAGAAAAEPGAPILPAPETVLEQSIPAPESAAPNE